MQDRKCAIMTPPTTFHPTNGLSSKFSSYFGLGPLLFHQSASTGASQTPLGLVSITLCKNLASIAGGLNVYGTKVAEVLN
jgi:hypothetical protein